MRFIQLAQLFETLEKTASRNEMTSLLSEFLKKCDLEEGQIVLYLLIGRVAPLFVSAEFNYSEKGIISVLNTFAQLNKSDFDAEKVRSQLGDIGLTAKALFEKLPLQKSESIELKEIYEKLWKIINTSGTGSIEVKGQILAEILKQLSPIEAQYVARIIVGKLRLGASDKTVIDALSYMLVGTKEYSEQIKSSYGVHSDLGLLFAELYKGGIEALANPKPILGIPIKSRLVERVKDFSEVFERLGSEIILQPKFDGLRCQAHLGVKYEDKDYTEVIWAKYFATNAVEQGGMFEVASKANVKLFSRNLEELTDMFPDIVEDLQKLEASECILDGEMIGFNQDTGEFLPFQETMTRKRKHGVEGAVSDVPVRLYVFDILSLNGKSLMDVDTSERLSLLRDLIAKSKCEKIVLSESITVKSDKELKSFFDLNVKAGLEGIIAKQLAGGYKPGIRNFEWIKLKKSMDKKLVDTIDVVIMGYYYGSGKKTSFGMGALLGGVYNSETEKIESITKIGTGITDEQWRSIADRLKPLEVAQRPIQYEVADILLPDIWVAPEVVCAVEADEITRSKVHKASLDSEGNGLALRFPRLVDFDRDKRVDQATWSDELRRLFEM